MNTKQIAKNILLNVENKHGEFETGYVRNNLLMIIASEFENLAEYGSFITRDLHDPVNEIDKMFRFFANNKDMLNEDVNIMEYYGFVREYDGTPMERWNVMIDALRSNLEHDDMFSEDSGYGEDGRKSFEIAAEIRGKLNEYLNKIAFDTAYEFQLYIKNNELHKYNDREEIYEIHENTAKNLINKARQYVSDSEFDPDGIVETELSWVDCA